MKLRKRIFNIAFVLTFSVSAISGLLHEPLIDAGIYKYIHTPSSYIMLGLGIAHMWRYRKVIKKSITN